MVVVVTAIAIVLVVAIASASMVVAATRGHVHQQQLTALNELVRVRESIRGRGVDLVVGLIDNQAARDEQVRQGTQAMRMLGLGGPPPSLRAADILLDIAGIARKQQTNY